MKKRADLEQAQHVLDVACNSDLFNQWVGEKNCRATHQALRAFAMDVLADQFPDVDVKVVPYPGSEWVDLEVVAKKTAGGSGTLP
jgi:hypothetical protein